jgi:hypothetical protein
VPTGVATPARRHDLVRRRTVEDLAGIVFGGLAAEAAVDDTDLHG